MSIEVTKEPIEIRLERLALTIGTTLGQIAQLLNYMTTNDASLKYVYECLFDINKSTALQVHELYFKNNNRPENPILQKDISDYDVCLSVRTVNCLKAEKINTVGDLIGWSASKLLRTPNLGSKSLKEIETALKNLGLCLKGDGQ